MLKFFRNIRQRLLSESKFSKYLIYAIGEIILVVIGILIALQVNNWNGARKSETAQNQLLLKLVDDLKKDIYFFDRIDSVYQQDLKEIAYVIDEALSFKNNSLTSPTQMVAGRGSALYLAVTKSTYNEMINTGLLYQVNNSELKNTIISYYTLADFLLEKENRDNQNFNSYLLGIKDVDPKKLIMRLREQRNLDKIDWNWLQNPNAPMYREIETNMVWTKASIEANQKVMEELKQESLKLQSEILAYLDSF